MIAQSGLAEPNIFESEKTAEHTDLQRRVNLSDQRPWEKPLQTTKHQSVQHWRNETTASHQRIRPTAIHTKSFGDDVAESNHYQKEMIPKANKTLLPCHVWICLLDYYNPSNGTSAQPFYPTENTGTNRIVRDGSPDPDRITTRRRGGLWRQMRMHWLDRN